MKKIRISGTRQGSARYLIVNSLKSLKRSSSDMTLSYLLGMLNIALIAGFIEERQFENINRLLDKRFK